VNEEAESATILVAEDHPDSRDALCALLEAYGYRVAVAENGRQAVEQAVAVHPDLILMDIMMPGLDGLQATRILRSRKGFESTPIIALTAMEGARERVREAGCDAYFPKPIDVHSFLKMVGDWVSRGRTPNGHPA
jgi:CheY-like chemotaxis protein